MPAQRQPQSECEDKVQDYLEYLEVEKGSSTLTIRNYRHYLLRFCDWMKHSGYRMMVQDINPEIVRQYRVYLARLPGSRGVGTMSRKTQGYHAIAIRSLLRWLTKNDFKVMSADKIDLPKIAERQGKFLSGDMGERTLNSPSLDKINSKRGKDNP